jgi:copper chaperone
MAMIVYDVPGISCGHCKAAIEAEVAKVEGVQSVDVSVDDRTVTVEGSAPDARLRAAIDEAGYEVAGAR